MRYCPAVRWLGILLVAIASGCSAEGLVFVPTPPTDAEAKVLVLIFDYEGVLSGQVVETPLPPEIRLEMDSQLVGQPRVYALSYKRDATSLSFTPGKLVAAGQGSVACERGSPLRVISYQTGDDDQADWVDTELPNNVRSFLLGSGTCQPTDLCFDFRAEHFELESSQNVQLILPLAEGRYLLSNVARVFYELTDSGVVRRPEYDGLPSLFGFVDSRQTAWFSGREGRIAFGPLEGPFIEETIGSTISIGAVKPSPSGERVLAVATKDSDRLEVHLRVGGVWSLIHTRPIRDSSTQQTNVFWVDEQTALFNYGGQEILRVNDRFVSALAGLSDVKSMLFGDGVLWVGGRGGVVFRSEAPYREFSSVRNSELGMTVDGMAFYRDGLVIGGAGGSIRQIYPGFAGCMTQQIVRSDVETLLIEGERIVTSGGNPDNRFNQTVSIVERLN